MSLTEDYLLGVNQAELERLRFQHEVWGSVTNAFFDRLNVGKGWKCLDVGAGPGFVTMDLRERVGEAGEVTALEPSQFYLEWLRNEVRKRSWSNIKLVLGRVEEVQLPVQHYDLIFVRWVIAFVADPEKFFVVLLKSLRPGGVIAFQDYYYEGLSLFPRGGSFDEMPKAVKAYYKSVGGDPYVTGRVPAFLRKHGLKLVEFSPHILAGGPESGIMEWAHRFFTTHIQAMVDKGATTQAQGDSMLADWFAHRNNPDALFFSPIVVDVAGRREG
jgi:SAM-dependent methyltransferase